MTAKSLVLCLALVSYAGGQDIEYHQISGDETFELTCTYSGDCLNKDIRIKAESGYKALITVKSVDVNGGNGDFILLKSGYADNDGLTGRIFTHRIKQERQYVSLTEEILVRFVVQDTDIQPTGYEGFFLTVENYGELETTVAPVPTERPWPIPSEDDNPYITVNITVTNIENITTTDFKTYLSDLANNFIDNSDFELEERISEDNVQIKAEKRCPREWRHSATCTQVTFAIPVFLAEDSKYNGTYQLNSSYLRQIWESSENYDHPNYRIYQKDPEHKDIMLVWIAIAGGTVIFWGAVYLASGYGWTGYMHRKKKKDAEENNSSEANHSKRESINSLSPHPLQQMPKFFDADVIYYNPDSPTVAVRNATGRTDHHDDPRDTLDASNLNLRAFSFTGQDVNDVTET